MAAGVSQAFCGMVESTGQMPLHPVKIPDRGPAAAIRNLSPAL